MPIIVPQSRRSRRRTCTGTVESPRRDRGAPLPPWKARAGCCRRGDRSEVVREGNEPAADTEGRWSQRRRRRGLNVVVVMAGTVVAHPTVVAVGAGHLERVEAVEGRES